MRLALLNRATDARVTTVALHAIALALTEQLQEHFGPMWEQAFSPVIVAKAHDLGNPPDDAAVITIFDDADQAGELGDHELIAGLPVGRIFAKTILDAGGTMLDGPLSVSAVCSHEACEIGGDPYADWWCEHPSGDVVALETADPVEDESYQASNGVALSNFVGPRWFRDGKGPFDYLGTRKAPFEVSSGGYVILREQGPVFGSKSKEARRAWKEPRRGASAKMRVGNSKAPLSGPSIPMKWVRVGRNLVRVPS